MHDELHVPRACVCVCVRVCVCSLQGVTRTRMALFPPQGGANTSGTAAAAAEANRT